MAGVGAIGSTEAEGGQKLTRNSVRFEAARPASLLFGVASTREFPLNATRERIGVADRHDFAEGAVLEDLAHAFAAVGRDHGKSGVKRFDQDIPKAFAIRRQHKQVGLCHMDIGIWLIPQELTRSPRPSSRTRTSSVGRKRPSPRKSKA